MKLTEVELIRKSIELHPYDPQVYRDGVAILYEGIQNGNAGLHAENKELRKEISKVIRMCGNVHELEMLNDTYWKSMLIDAPVDFDSFNLYLERYIPADKKIYQPRRKALMPFVEALQEAHEGKLDFISGSVPKRVGKTTIGTRFVLFREGKCW